MSYAIKREMASVLDILFGLMLGYFIFNEISIWLLLVVTMVMVIIKDEFL